MTNDVYALCPCGSGKKLKFCCLTIAEQMERIQKLAEGGNIPQSLQQLENLSRQTLQPDSAAWVATTRAMLLLQSNDAGAARDLMEAFLKFAPEHELGIAMFAVAKLQADGLDGARPAINRALQKSLRKQPTLMGGLAMTIGMMYQMRGEYLAAREHLALAMRIVPDSRRQEVFMRLLDFDNNRTIPYLLRGSHPLPDITTDDENQLKEVRRAHKYAAVGCWGIAAELFEKLTAILPAGAAAWHAAGLCYAFSGNSPVAAVSLHQASRLYQTGNDALDCEAIAQQLEAYSTGDVLTVKQTTFEIASVGRVLTLLDALPGLQRAEIAPNAENPPVASYSVLDRPRLEVMPAEATTDQIPRRAADLTIDDADAATQTPAILTVGGPNADVNEQTIALLRQTLGAELLVRVLDEKPAAGRLPRMGYFVSPRFVLPNTATTRQRMALEAAFVQQQTLQVWPDQPNTALGNQTPRAVAANADAHSLLVLLASVLVLDAACVPTGVSLELETLRQQLGLPEATPTDLPADASINALSVLELHRLQPDRLTDDQLVAVTNRALLIDYPPFLYRVLVAAVDRPGCREELDLKRVYMTLADLSRRGPDRSEVLRWINTGRELAAQSESRFEAVWEWDLREFAFRLEDPHAPETMPYIERFHTYYAPKLPQLDTYIREVLTMVGLELPRIATLGSGGLGGGASGGALWTPGSDNGNAAPVGAGSVGASGSGEGGGKLWLPG